jgi:ABC-2 type transport system ATP-binding protein
MIVAQDLSKRFGKVVAVDSVSFRIEPGRVVGFLGPNGAGKTTTIRMIAGFTPPTAGSITVDGRDVVRRPIDIRRRIGYLPEATPLYSEMRVIEYLRFRSRLFGVARRRRTAAIAEVLRRCRIEDVRRRTIGHLSKGYRQRVGLAAALLHDPPVLILDEPTVGLDPGQIREVRALMRELAGQRTVLLSTHILPEVEQTCDEVIMMARGCIQAQGTIEQLRASASRGGAKYVVETDAQDAAAKIRALAAVKRGEAKPIEDGWFRVTVTPDPGAEDLRELIARTLARGGHAVRELRRESPTLEQMFMRITAGTEVLPASDQSEIEGAIS